MKNSRAKGANGERELAGLIQSELGVRLIRNLEQTRSGGNDLVVHPEEDSPVASQLARYGFEVKRHHTATQSQIAGWWGQTETQAASKGLIPLLAFRADRQDWRLVVQMADIHPDFPREWRGLEWTATLSVQAFAALVREAQELREAQA